MIEGQDESKIRLEMPIGREMVVNRIHEALKDKVCWIISRISSMTDCGNTSSSSSQQEKQETFTLGRYSTDVN